MTPDEFRDRAAVAVAPLEPSPVSYEWLRDNVARRRRRSRLLTVATAAAVVAVAGVGFAALPGRDGTVTPPAGSPAPRAAVALDVDGDGIADPTQVVDEFSPRRWGVEVDRSRLGKVTVWMPDDLGTHGHAISDSTDVDLDGRAEVVVGVGENDLGAQQYALLVPVGDDLVWVTGGDGKVDVIEDGGADESSYGCLDVGPEPGRELALQRGDGDQTVRTYYRFDEGRMVFVGSDKGPGLLPLESCSATE